MKQLAMTGMILALAVAVAQRAAAEVDASPLTPCRWGYQQSRVPTKNADLERKVTIFVFDFFATRSGTDIRSLKALEGFYAEDVQHRGRRTRRESVMIDLRNSFTHLTELRVSVNFGRHQSPVDRWVSLG
jgi:hypothetical protein